MFTRSSSRSISLPSSRSDTASHRSPVSRLEDRGAHQEVPDRPRLREHHLVPQVVDQEAVVGRQRVEHPSAIGTALEPQRGQVQPGHPTLDPLLDGCDLGRVEVEAVHVVEQHRGLLVGEPQLFAADLGEIAHRPQPAQAQWRVGLRGDDDVHVQR